MKSSGVTLDLDVVEKKGRRVEDLCASEVGGEAAESSRKATLCSAASRVKQSKGAEWRLDMGRRCARTEGVYMQFNKLVATVPGPTVQGSRMPLTHQLILGSTCIYSLIN